VVQSDRTAALFGRLLALLVALFVLLPFVEPRGFAVGAGRIAVEVAIVAAVWRLRSSLHVPVLVTAITALNELTGWLEKISPEPFLVVTSRVITLVFLGVTGVFLSRYFWKHRVVDAGSLAGALSVYLLLGYFWGTAFGLLEYLEPDSFQGACLPRPDGASSCDALRADFPRLGYLGFVTLTTLGYGDVTPRTLHAEGLTSLAAVSGQLFLAVLIGRLVGSYVSQRAGRAAAGTARDEESQPR
jgi:hypothetical protein